MNQLLALVEIHLRVVAREAVPCAADGEPLFIQQAPYLPNDQHVLALIVPAVAAALDGLELREFLFPIAQHMRFDAAQVADFTDGEIPLSRDRREFAIVGLVQPTPRPGPSISAPLRLQPPDGRRLVFLPRFSDCATGADSCPVNQNCRTQTA